MKRKDADRQMYEAEARAFEAGLERALTDALAKLDALRAAAERYLQDEAYGVGGLTEFLAAIEASR